MEGYLARGSESAAPRAWKGTKTALFRNLNEDPGSAQEAEHLGSAETKSECEQSFSTTLEVGGALLESDEESAVASDRGATANVARPERLRHRKTTFEEIG